MAKKNKLEELSAEELVAYNKMVDMLVSFYENQTYVDGGTKETKEKYFFFQKMRNAIFNEIEGRVFSLNEKYKMV